jgi:hypothetical protein
MKFINEKGQLFGKLSVIDLLVTLAVVALVAGLVYKRASGEVQQIVNASTPFYMTLKAEHAREYSVNAVGEGDVFFRQNDTQRLGTVVRVDTEPAEDIMVKTDGTALLAKSEDRYSLYITLACTGNISDAGYYVNGSTHLAEGNDVRLQSNRLEIGTTVYRIAETEYAPGE